MKALAIALLLAISSISSVSSAMCMKKFLASQGLAPNPSTNFYNQMQHHDNSVNSTTSSNDYENVNRQR
jgi:hypothetical protein